jgi:hypothetical protein
MAVAGSTQRTGRWCPTGHSVTPMAKGRYAASLLACLLLAACGPASSTEIRPALNPFPASGSVTLVDVGAGAVGQPCQGLRDRGYADVSSDTGIKVTDGRGDVVSAVLGPGTFAPPPAGVEPVPGSMVVCDFSFTIEGIAGGQPPYSFTVANHGRVRFSRDQADSLRLLIDDTGLTRVTDGG